MLQLRSSQNATVWSTFPRTALLLLILWPGFARGAEPVFTYLQPGESAPFCGYLLSPEAVGNVVTVDEERRLKDLAKHEMECREAKADLTRQIKESGARIERLSGEITVITDAREAERIAYGKEAARLRRRAWLYAGVGAAAGAGIAVVALSM